jgi:hypothetical protein
MTDLPSLVPVTQLTLPKASRQLSIVFETIPLRGVIQAERTKIVRHLDQYPAPGCWRHDGGA